MELILISITRINYSIFKHIIYTLRTKKLFIIFECILYAKYQLYQFQIIDMRDIYLKYQVK